MTCKRIFKNNSTETFHINDIVIMYHFGTIFAKKTFFPTSNDITSGLLVHSWRTQKKKERELELVFENKKKVEKTKDVINFD